jgi:hypothetical protein
MLRHTNTIANTHHSSTGTPEREDASVVAVLVGAGVGVSVGVGVAVGTSVAVGAGVGASVGRGVAVGAVVAVGSGVGHGVLVGIGVGVGGASRVSTALAVARAALTTAVASSQPGTVHCACTLAGQSAHNNTISNKPFMMFLLRPTRCTYAMQCHQPKCQHWQHYKDDRQGDQHNRFIHHLSLLTAG